MPLKELKTKWTGGVTAETAWREYPRPSLARPGYQILNGLWEYAITKTEEEPSAFDGTILVPFSPEAPLSGVKRQVMPDEWLWYRRKFRAQPGLFSGGAARSAGKTEREGQRLLLHFGAVDQSCTVYVNGKEAGSHTGGYLPFTVDITSFCREENILLVKVKDISDTGWHSRGKQKLSRGGMFYTAQSGIWQTVWLELVPENYLRHVRITPDYDGGKIKLRAVSGKEAPLSVTVFEEFTDEGLTSFLETGKVPSWKTRTALSAVTGREISVPMEEFLSWTPETPKLYGLLLESGGDRVLSYFAMRSIKVQKDNEGISRLFLNGRPYFQAGLLDQGYWPDGLYTAPCDEALAYDIEAAKEMGFNMLRKHVKVEQERWYYHCDRLGMLVWQDMVNGGSAYQSWFVTYLATAMSYLHISIRDSHRRLLSRREKEGRKAYVKELAETVKLLYNHPSVVCYIPFNEGWGQFDAGKATALLRRLDGTRLVDEASGWFDQGGGDIKSIHSYFLPFTFRKEARAAALTEFGGYSLRIEGHYQSEKEYGYKLFQTEKEFQDGYRRLMEQTVYPSVKKGISATVYTQLSDVEDETNGLLTYDRFLKTDRKWVRALNRPFLAGNREADEEPLTSEREDSR